MEIIYKNKKKVAFKFIAIGEVFNAVSMKDGEPSYFEASDEVVLVKAQLVIS